MVTYTATSAGRYASAIDTGTGINYAQGATYAPFGGLAHLNNSSTNISVTDSYNNRLQPLTLSATSSSGSILNLNYTFKYSAPPYGNNGNVIQIANNNDPSLNQTFTYDMLNRIVTGQDADTTHGWCWGYNYAVDNWGNHTNEAPSKCSGFSTYTPADTAGHNRISGTCYDVAGNYLGWSGCPSLPYSPEYNYDAENRLVTTQGVTYTYDGDGNRVEKSNGTLYWGESMGSAIAESDLSGNMQHEYISFNGNRVARLDIPSGVSPTASNAHYYFADHLESANVVTDYLGSMAPCPSGNSPAGYTSPNTTVATGEEESVFLPYGREVVLCDRVPQHYKFTGKERDTESGLDNFGARYDSSTLGRFMTPDWAVKPITVPYAVFGDPQTLNLYAFVENSPLNRADADGHCADHYNDGTCKVNVNLATGEAGAKAGKQLEGVLNKYDKAINGLNNKAKFDIKDSKGNVIGSMTGKEIKAVWNGTHFSITDKTFNNGGAGGGTSGHWKLFGGFSGSSELTPGAVKSYVDAASGRNEAPLVGLSTMTFHELSHEIHFGKALTARYPVTDRISPEREAGTSSAGRAMSGAVDAPFDCSIPAGGCE